ATLAGPGPVGPSRPRADSSCRLRSLNFPEPSMIDKSTRRDFIKQSTLLGTAWWVGQTAAGYADSKNPLERLNFACIGVSGKGSSDTDDAARNGNIVALCDIDDQHLDTKRVKLGAVGKLSKSAKTFNDYREMLDVMGDKIDAVTVSIPDHS